MQRKNEQKIGNTFEVVIEGYDRYAECCFGRTMSDAPEIDPKIFFTISKQHNLGDYLEVNVDEAMDCDLIGTEKE